MENWANITGKASELNPQTGFGQLALPKSAKQIKRNMAKKEEDKTLQEQIVARLEMPVAVKGGTTLKDPIDGHEMTAQEAIAYRMIEKALAGDVRCAQFVMQLEANNRLMQRNKK